MKFEDTIEEIKVRFEQTGELSSSDKSFIETKYERVLSKPYSRRNCGQCYQDAFIEMYTFYKKNGIKKMGLFKIKRGTGIHTSSGYYVRQNTTDEIAAKLLKENPKRADFFEELPENWEEIVDEILSGDGTDPKSKLNEDSSEQIAAEKAFIREIAKLLIDGTTKTVIKENFKGHKVGEKDIKTRELAEFIKQADDVLKDPEKLKELQSYQDEEEINLEELDRKGLEDFIKVNELTIEFDESTSDEDLRTLIVDAIDKDEE